MKPAILIISLLLLTGCKWALTGAYHSEKDTPIDQVIEAEEIIRE